MKIEENTFSPQTDSYFSSLGEEQKKSALVFVLSIQGHLNLDTEDSRNDLSQLAQNWKKSTSKDHQAKEAWEPLIQNIISYVTNPKQDKSKTISNQIDLIQISF